MSTTVQAPNAAVASAGSTTVTKSKKNNTDLSVTDFFTLLAAQLKNQNMLNPVNDTEFMAQMAQFSALSATQQLTATVTNLMAVSYIGKKVTVTETQSNGTTNTIQGTVEKVDFLNGETYITVNGERYDLSQITQVAL